MAVVIIGSFSARLSILSLWFSRSTIYLSCILSCRDRSTWELVSYIHHGKNDFSAGDIGTADRRLGSVNSALLLYMLSPCTSSSPVFSAVLCCAWLGVRRPSVLM